MLFHHPAVFPNSFSIDANGTIRDLFPLGVKFSIFSHPGVCAETTIATSGRSSFVALATKMFPMIAHVMCNSIA